MTRLPLINGLKPCTRCGEKPIQIGNRKYCNQCQSEVKKQDTNKRRDERVKLKFRTCKRCLKDKQELFMRKYCKECKDIMSEPKTKRRVKVKPRKCKRCNKVKIGKSKRFCEGCIAIKKKETIKNQNEKRKKERAEEKAKREIIMKLKKCKRCEKVEVQGIRRFCDGCREIKQKETIKKQNEQRREQARRLKQGLDKEPQEEEITGINPMFLSRNYKG